MERKIRIGVNGFGTIGKRVALAIKKQDDMELIGIVKTKADYNALFAQEIGIKIFIPSQDYSKNFENSQIKFCGTLEDLIEECDLIIDATPSGTGAKNKDVYEQKGVKAIFQGGEKPNVSEVSFNSQVNYENAINKKYVRVVSCNTTALSRTLNAIKYFIESVYVTIIRRAADPEESDKGPINSIIPTFNSHHASDLKTVLSIEKITTNAYVVPTTLMHMHDVYVALNKKISLEETAWLFKNAERVLLFDINDSAKIMDYSKNLNRGLGGDLYEVAVLEKSIYIKEDILHYTQAVHQESITVPENIDAVRAMFNLMNKEESTRKTDKSLGIIKNKNQDNFNYASDFCFSNFSNIRKS
ncbi:MAG: phosphorylating glyceraldehyde-3-phosphate dehydrogenase [Candidatus Woesearchaeota archaeon]